MGLAILLLYYYLTNLNVYNTKLSVNGNILLFLFIYY